MPSQRLAAVGWPFGFGFLFIALQEVMRGHLPTQSNSAVRSRTVHGDEEPATFWFNFLIYLAVGAFLCFLALGSLTA